MSLRRLDDLLLTFYTVPRAGQRRLSDGGGPFGFDVTTALQVDYLIDSYRCDGIVETGCHMGDTSEYLARRYSHLLVRTCDINDESALFTRARLRGYGNAEIRQGDSAALLPSLLEGFNCPLVFLDAHWTDEWPLARELIAIQRGIVVIDDFYIGHPRFGYDYYNGIVCGPDLVSDVLGNIEEMFVGNPYADFPAPCLQTGRRSGTGFLAIESDSAPLHDSPWFRRITLRPTIELPRWESAAEGA
jgi:hypothetical protein